jgi:hypothetical protein
MQDGPYFYNPPAMTYREHAPAPMLAEIVDRIWTLEGVAGEFGDGDQPVLGPGRSRDVSRDLDRRLARSDVGMGVTTIPGKPTEFEFLRIENRNGVPTYVARPGGKPPTPFASSSATADAVTFANPQHDFPKRIG